jgi:hypothetical protein
LQEPTYCAGYGKHRPAPTRFVWHHILPQVCGGPTVPANLAPLCDSCHYTVHALLHNLKLTGHLPRLIHRGTKEQRTFAQMGYDAAVKAGTVDKIPNEGEAA